MRAPQFWQRQIQLEGVMTCQSLLNMYIMQIYWKLVKRKERLQIGWITTSAYLRGILHPGMRPTTKVGFLGCCDRRVDAIDYYQGRIDVLNRKLFLAPFVLLIARLKSEETIIAKLLELRCFCFLVVNGFLIVVLNQIVYELPEHPLAETKPLRELLGRTPFLCSTYLYLFSLKKGSGPK